MSNITGARSQDVLALDLGLRLAGHPFTRRLLKLAVKRCDFCSHKPLKLGLEEYADTTNKQGLKQGFCWHCHLLSKFVSLVVDSGRFAFKVSKAQLAKFLRVPVKRRGLLSVLKGIAHHGVTKPQNLGAPFLVVWNYTNKCNLRCKHCYQNAGIKGRDELTTLQRKKVVDILERSDVVALAFSGGEPLADHDFFEVVDYAKDKGLYVAVATNGTLINDKVAGKIADIGVGYVEVSLDGAKPEVHDGLRGLPGAWQRTVKGIKACVDAGIYTCVATTAIKQNYEEIPEIVNLSYELGVKRVIVFNFIPVGRGREIADLDLSPEEREKLLNYLYLALNEYKGMQVVTTAPQFARISVREALKHEGPACVSPTHFAASPGLKGQTLFLADFIGGCGAGRMYCGLQPNGDIKPCVFLPNELILGNILKDNFEKLWLENPVLKALRDRDHLKGGCSDCGYKYICGGCRARAYNYFHDLKAPDPGCIKNRQYYEKLCSKPLAFRSR